MPDLPENVFAKTNPEGLIEIIDMHTGNVVAVQASYREIMKGKQDRLVEVDTPQGKVWLERGLAAGAIKFRNYAMDEVAASLVCDYITRGCTLTEAAREIGLDPNIVKHWTHRFPEFQKRYKQAILDRADIMHDKVLEEAKASSDTKVRIDAYKYMAEKGNPEAYGNRTKVVGDPNAPVTFVIETGIRRAGDPGYKEGKDAAENHLEPGGSKETLPDQPEDAVLVVEGSDPHIGVSPHDGNEKDLANLPPGVDDSPRADHPE